MTTTTTRGSPPTSTRRLALLTLAGATALASTPAAAERTLPSFLPCPDPDAELIDLGRRWRELMDLCDAAEDRYDAACDIAWTQPRPAAFTVRPDDWRLIGSRLEDALRRGRDHYLHGDIASFRKRLAAAEGEDLQRILHGEASKARLCEIVEADDQLARDKDAALAALGGPEHRAEADRLWKVIGRLEDRILALQATTAAGMLVKLRLLMRYGDHIPDEAHQRSYGEEITASIFTDARSLEAA